MLQDQGLVLERSTRSFGVLLNAKNVKLRFNVVRRLRHTVTCDIRSRGPTNKK